MKLKINITLLILLNIIGLVKVNAQQTFNKGGRVLLTTLKQVNNASFHIYNPPFEAKPIYSDTLDAINEYPEQLMISAISASNQEWVNYNTFGGAENAQQKDEAFFNYVENMNADSNYFELRSKLSFEIDGETYSVIKFYLHSDAVPKPKSGAYVMKMDDGRWRKTSTLFTSNIALMMMRFQEVKLGQVLIAENTNNQLINDLIDRVRVTQQTIDFSLLFDEFQRWYTENDTTNLNFFIDENAW